MCPLGISFAISENAQFHLFLFQYYKSFIYLFIYFHPCMFWLLLRNTATQIAEKLLLSTNSLDTLNNNNNSINNKTLFIDLKKIDYLQIQEYEY